VVGLLALAMASAMLIFSCRTKAARA
jgi:hypothetical protein